MKRAARTLTFVDATREIKPQGPSCGIDAGGTFTDLVLRTPGGERVHKLPSTPDNPARAVLAGIRHLLGRTPGAGDSIVHGTTVATNALLERRGARAALVTNAGFEDLIEIGRQNRPDIYALRIERPDPVIRASCASASRRERSRPEPWNGVSPMRRCARSSSGFGRPRWRPSPSACSTLTRSPRRSGASPTPSARSACR